MGAYLRVVFERHARAPLAEAQVCLSRRNVRGAVDALREVAWRAAVARAVQGVASAAWVRPIDVERRVANAAIEPALVATSLAQVRAGEMLDKAKRIAWGGRPPRGLAMGAYLRWVAAHVADEASAKALEALSEQVTVLEATLARAARHLERDASLAHHARRARRLRITTGVAVGLVTLAAALVGYVSVARSHRLHPTRSETARVASVSSESSARIESVLALTDPCAATLAPQDRVHATDDQRTRYVARMRACDAQIARRDVEEPCQQLADDVKAGRPPRTDALPRAQAALLQRIALGALEPSDVLARAQDLPCDGTLSGMSLWESLAEAAARAGEAYWSNIERVSPEVSTALSARRRPLEPPAEAALRVHAERFATAMLMHGTANDLQRARDLCGFKEAMRIPLDWQCRRVMKAH